MKRIEPSVAMVLAAGRGERMRPLSDIVPKPALPLPDGPVVASALRLARSANVQQVVVNTSHLARRMAAAVIDAPHAGVKLVFSEEPTLMGTSGGLALAHRRGLLGDRGPVLVINADGIFDLDLGPLIERHLAASDRITLALLPHPDPSRWSQVVLDHSGRVRGIRPPGSASGAPTGFLYPGVMIVERRTIAGLAATPHDTPKSLWWPALEAGRLSGAVVTGGWHEIGTPADYLETVTRMLGDRSHVHGSADVSPTAHVIGSLVTDGGVVGDGASVRKSVIGEGAIVGAGATVVRSVIFGAVEIEAGQGIVGQYLAAPA
jgi:mannose-1-phosphate guanylyltransferase